MKSNVSKMSMRVLFMLFGVLAGYRSPSQAANLETVFENKVSQTEIVFVVQVNALNTVEAFGLDIQYDALLLRYKSFDRNDSLTQNFSYFDVNEVTSGKLRIGGFDASGHSFPQGTNGVLVRLRFEIIGEGIYKLTPINLIDDIYNWTTATGTADRFEPDDSITFSGIVDKPQRHNFHKHGDHDWGWFYGIPGETYTIQTVNLEAQCDTIIEVADMDGSILAAKNDSGSGLDETLKWVCPGDGIYYVKISHANPVVYGENTGYTFQIQFPRGDAYEIDDSSKNARIIVINDEAQNHTFYHEKDQDWVIFYGLAGTSYNIEAVNVDSSYDVQIELFVEQNSRKVMVKSVNNGGFGQNEEFTWACPEDDTYYVRAVLVRLKPERSELSSYYGYGIKISTATSGFTAILIGSVKNAVNQKSIQYVKIETSGSYPASTFFDGRYTIFNHPAGSTYFISASKDGFQPNCGPKYIGIPLSIYDISLCPCNGDTNGDGQVTAADAKNAFDKYMRICPTTYKIACDFTSCSVPFVCCDVNLDGACTTVDAFCILNKYLGKPSCLDYLKNQIVCPK